jgi:hypothetical protein
MYLDRGQVIPCASFRCVHISAKFRGHHGASCFTSSGTDADASEKTVMWNINGKIRIVRLKVRGACVLVDRV